MKSEITISELAKLMNVSVHQIRYFEEKGVLLPAYIDNNQYRMYSMDQVYQLAHILLLRNYNVVLLIGSAGLNILEQNSFDCLWQSKNVGMAITYIRQEANKKRASLYKPIPPSIPRFARD